MALRLLILQAHYRSPLDFSDEALQAAHKAYLRLLQIGELLGRIQPGGISEWDVTSWEASVFAALDDDLNTAQALAQLFSLHDEAVRLYKREVTLRGEDLERLRRTWKVVVEDILGLLPLKAVEKSRWDAVMSLIITLRRKARAEKNYALADFIRDELAKAGIRLLDFPHETLWELEA